MKLRSQSAYSLVFALVMMTGIMLVASSTVENTHEKVVFFADIEAPSKARLASESSIDLALSDLRNQEAGYGGTVDDAFCKTFLEEQKNSGVENPSGSDSDCQSAGAYEVISTGAEINDRWTIPASYTGSAAPEGACTEPGSPEDNTDYNRNHACHWNKLLYGDTDVIPLYSVDSNGDLIYPQLESNWEEWVFKVRTPCKDGSLECDPLLDRYMLNVDFNDYANDDIVVQWQLVAELDDGNSVVLNPDGACHQIPGVCVFRDMTKNTEIFESLVNDPFDVNSISSAYAVLKAKEVADGGGNEEYYPLWAFTTGDDSVIGTDKSLERIFLQIKVVTPLVEQNGNSVPYLEWQLVSDGTEPFADNKFVIIGEGTYVGRGGTYYFKEVVTQPSVDESNVINVLSL